MNDSTLNSIAIMVLAVTVAILQWRVWNLDKELRATSRTLRIATSASAAEVAAEIQRLLDANHAGGERR